MTDVTRSSSVTSTTFPAFDDLPYLGSGTTLRHSWDVHGRDDDLGTVNRITPEAVRAGAALVESGVRVGLCLPIEEPGPPLFGRSPVDHSIARGDYGWDDTLDNFNPQSSTQWDGLRHIRGRSTGHYGGWDGDTDADPGRLGVQHWADRGILGRGLLADVTAVRSYDPLEGRAITVEDLDEALSRVGVEPRPGDVLCVRTGWADRYTALSAGERSAYAAQFDGPAMAPWAGLKGNEGMARYLWNTGYSAVAVDNPGVEVSPGDPWFGTLHRQLIPGLGFAIGELFDFGGLARACQDHRRWEFFFVSVPLKVTGGVGSPGNAIAIF